VPYQYQLKTDEQQNETEGLLKKVQKREEKEGPFSFKSNGDELIASTT
jgi:hypothetical protein